MTLDRAASDGVDKTSIKVSAASIWILAVVILLAGDMNVGFVFSIESTHDGFSGRILCTHGLCARNSILSSFTCHQLR